MSRSNPNENLVNPAKFFYEWDGGDGGFKYFDKSLGEKGEKVKQELPFTFIPLDVLVTIKGFNESEQKGYWSNEIRQFDIKTGILTVRSKAGVEMIGTYEQVKAKLGTKGADYCQSVYCATKGADGKLVLNNIQIKGAALGAWIEFVKKNNINEVAVAVKDMVKKKKGRVDYVEPVFSAVKIKEETNQEAIELDKLLQEYLRTLNVDGLTVTHIDHPPHTFPIAVDVRVCVEFDGDVGERIAEVRRHWLVLYCFDRTIIAYLA